MQSEINAEGVDAVVSRVLQLRNAHDDRPQADRDTGMPQRVSELVAMVDPGAEVIKVSTAGSPGRVLLTLTPHGACATPAASVHETRRPKHPAAVPFQAGARRSTQKSAGCTGTTPSSSATPTQADIERSPQLSRRTVRMRPAYVRASLCTPGELPLCTVRICVPSTSGAYALALLAIGALDESVSLSDKTEPGR
jgi:hypothetical protein